MLRDLSKTGKFGVTATAKLSRLEERLASPHMWIDPKVKGAFYAFAVGELSVLEHASKVSAARFSAKLRSSAVSVTSAFGGTGFAFQVSTIAARVCYTIKFDNIVAACFGKAAPGFYLNDDVVAVTLIAAHATRLQVLTFRLKSKDATICKRLVNQKGGIGTQLIESKYVTGDAVSARTKAILSVFRKRNPSRAPGDLATWLGSSFGWEAIEPDDALRSSPGLGRISHAVAAHCADVDVPSLAEVMADAPSNASPEGMFTRGDVLNIPSAHATGRSIKCWPEAWETFFSEVGDARGAKAAFETKYLHVKVKFMDLFEGTVFKILFDRTDEPHRWNAKARADDGAEEPYDGSDSDEDADAPANTSTIEAPKRPAEVPSKSQSIALRRPKCSKSSSSRADDADGD